MAKSTIDHIRDNNRLMEHVIHYYAQAGREWDGGAVARDALEMLVGHEAGEEELEVSRRSRPHFTRLDTIPAGSALVITLDLKELLRQGGVEDADHEYITKFYDVVQEQLHEVIRMTPPGDIIITADGINFKAIIPVGDDVELKFERIDDEETNRG